MKIEGYYISFLLLTISNVCGFFEPKTYVFYERETDWNDAVRTCKSNGATLPSFSNISDVMDVVDQVQKSSCMFVEIYEFPVSVIQKKEGNDLQQDSIATPQQNMNISVWIGLTWNESKWVTMEDSDFTQSSINRSVCASMRLNSNGRPTESSCDSRKSFFCLFPAGYCRYRKYPQTSIVGHNTFTVLSVSLQYCQQICDQTTEFTCLSFEYKESSRYCQLSNTNRWLVPLSFAYDVISWDYYHRTCVWAFEQENRILHTSSIHSTLSTTTTTITATTLNGKDISEARKYILYDIPKSWKEARDFCSQEGGILATIYDESVLPETGLIDDNHSPKKVWIGLTRLGTREWHWLSGTTFEWTKWKYIPNEIDLRESCGTVLLDQQGWWYPMHCESKHPFMCQFFSAYCRYEITENAALIMHNRKVFNDVTMEECKQECDQALDFLCKSFEFNIHTNSCQLSDENRWTAANFLRKDMTGWNYYHRRCNFGASDFQTTEFSAFTTTERTSFATDSDSTLMTSSVSLSTEDTESESSTQVFEEEFERMKEELEDMGRTIRSKNLQRSRTSAWDSRPSAASVGVVATVILVSFLSVIVMLDLATICQHCKHMHPKKSKKSRMKKYIHDNIPKYATESVDKALSENQNLSPNEIKSEPNPNSMIDEIANNSFVTLEDRKAQSSFFEIQMNETQVSKL